MGAVVYIAVMMGFQVAHDMLQETPDLNSLQVTLLICTMGLVIAINNIGENR